MCPLSTSNHQTEKHQELIQGASLPPGDGPDRFSPASVKEWHPRRKSVSNACERCRRRKIRCDGNTPCATCGRFSLQCIRTQKPREVVARQYKTPNSEPLTKGERMGGLPLMPEDREHQAALEGRIHQLEAQLAAHVNAPMHGMDPISEDSVAETPPFDWQNRPPLTVDTGSPAPYGPGSEIDLATFSAGSVPPASFQRFEPRSNILSPDSPAPSFWSGTTGGSSPDMVPSAPALHYLPNFAMPSMPQPFPQPTPLRSAPSLEFLAQTPSQSHLKPPARSAMPSRTSRTSSVSSASGEYDDSAALSYAGGESEDEMLSMDPAPHLNQSGRKDAPSPAASRAGPSERSRSVNPIPAPSRFEAETLTTEFVQYIQTLEDPKPYSISPAIFGRFCTIVYPDPQSRSSSVDAPISVPMARFHVFLAMAIGMKLRIRDSAEPTNSLLDRCYELAMQQASYSVFWTEQGSVEATQLLNIFASIKKDPGFEPKPLASSLSW